MEKVQKKKRKYLSNEERIEIVRLHFLEGVTRTKLCETFGVGNSVIARILAKFAASNNKSVLLMRNKPTNNQEEEIRALRQEIMDLKNEVKEATMRADFYETMVDVAEDMFGIEIRKKAVTGQSKGCTERKVSR